MWCDHEYGVGTRWQSPIARPALVGGDTLIGEDEVTEVAPEHRDRLHRGAVRARAGELDGWSGLAANFAHEVQGFGAQAPALAKWWAQAAQFRRDGVDRILVPEPWRPTIDKLIEGGIGGEVYAHELATTAPGAVGRYLEALAEVECDTMAAFHASPVGAFRVAMRNDTEAIAIWAFPSFEAWAAFEEAWEGDHMSAWWARLVAMGVDVQRTLMVDAPLAPLRIRRQPSVEDRHPLDEIP